MAEPKTSSHILNASSNLLGICFVVLTSIHLLHFSEKTIVDDLTIGATVLFMSTSILSFLALRLEKQSLETIADILFFLGLLTLFITAMLFSLNVIS